LIVPLQFICKATGTGFFQKQALHDMIFGLIFYTADLNFVKHFFKISNMAILVTTLFLKTKKKLICIF